MNIDAIAWPSDPTEATRRYLRFMIVIDALGGPRGRSQEAMPARIALSCCRRRPIRPRRWASTSNGSSSSCRWRDTT